MPKYEIDVEDVRRRYVEELEDVARIAAHYGCSVHNIRRILKKHEIRRGKRFITSGKSRVWNRGVRDPKAKRNQVKPKAWSKEHREKLAAAKRGRRGEKSNAWKGGLRQLNASLYMERRVTVDGRRIYEHRYVAEQALGRRLETAEQVHHVDRDRTNNAPSNLIVLGRTDHNRLHRAIDAGHVSKAQQIALLEQSNINFEVCDGEGKICHAAE